MIDPRQMSSRALAMLWGTAFVSAFLAGIVPNPLVGPDGLFLTNTAHDLVHLVTAFAFFAMAFRSTKAVRTFMLVFGVVYALTGLAGFAVTGFGGGMGMLLGIVCINLADNFLHLVLGAGIFFTGRLLPNAPERAEVVAADAA